MINVFYKRGTHTPWMGSNAERTENGQQPKRVVSHFNAQIMSSFVGNMSNR